MGHPLATLCPHPPRESVIPHHSVVVSCDPAKPSTGTVANVHVALHELVQYDLALTAAAVSTVGVSPPGAQQQKLGPRQSE